MLYINIKRKLKAALIDIYRKQEYYIWYNTIVRWSMPFRIQRLIM